MNNEKRCALICGISGQDGAYLANFLLSKGYAVYGTSRDAQMSPFHNLVRLGIRDKVRLESVALNDFRSVLQVLMKVQPDEVYNLAGQSSVGLSFYQPVETLESISVGTLNLLEAIRFSARPIKFYNAGSGECFGDTDEGPADETTPFRPRSPYAVAKAAAFWEVANYREAYGIFACNGILFNHESARRGENFVTRKITTAVARIKLGLENRLTLGNLDARRDWGYAKDYVEAMWLMLQQKKADDFVIATGQAHTVREFLEEAFGYLKLDWKKYVRVDRKFFRPLEVNNLRGDASKARRVLGWKPKTSFRELVRLMVDADLEAAMKHG